VRYPGTTSSFSQSSAATGLPPRKAEVTDADGPELELNATVPPARPASSTRAPARAAARAGGDSLFMIHPEELRARICERPEILEAGLHVFKEKGKELGAGYSTEIGEIDLLAEDAKGALVVVMVPGEGSAQDFVGEVLQRVGWVAKHVAKPKQTVRAIVLLEPPVPELGYAASAVADTVAFKTWRVALTIDDVDA